MVEGLGELSHLSARRRYLNGWGAGGRLRDLVDGRLTSRGVDGVGVPETAGKRDTVCGKWDVVVMRRWVRGWGPLDARKVGGRTNWSRVDDVGTNGGLTSLLSRHADLPFPES